MQHLDVSVVIPVYNGAASLIELHEKLRDVLEEHSLSFEMILVDDASPNADSWSTMSSLAEKDDRVRVFQLLANSGQHAATLCGLRQARGNLIVTMDDDLQHPPAEIPRLLEAYGAGAQWDAIFGVPETREEAHSTFRNLGSWLFKQFMRLTIPAPKGLRFSSFRLLNRPLCDAVVDYRGYVVTLNSLICMNSSRVVNTTVDFAPRAHGQSGYSIYKLVSLALNHLFNFSSTPLKAMSIGGALISLLSMAYAVLVMYWRLTGVIHQAGFATITILISFYSGVILLAISVIGQYVIRVVRTTTMGTQYHLRQGTGVGEVSLKTSDPS